MAKRKEKSAVKTVFQIVSLKLLMILLAYGGFWAIISFPESFNFITLTFLLTLEIELSNKKILLPIGLTLLLLGVLIDFIFLLGAVYYFTGVYINELSKVKYERSPLIINISVYPIARSLNKEFPKATKQDVMFTVVTAVIVILMGLLNPSSFRLGGLPFIPYSDWMPI